MKQKYDIVAFRRQTDELRNHEPFNFLRTEPAHYLLGRTGTMYPIG